MFEFGSKKSSANALSWDPTREEPVVKKSICTGEATVGFVDKNTGKYRDVRKVTTPAEIEAFCKEAGLSDTKIRTIY